MQATARKQPWQAVQMHVPVKLRSMGKQTSSWQCVITHLVRCQIQPRTVHGASHCIHEVAGSSTPTSDTQGKPMPLSLVCVCVCACVVYTLKWQLECPVGPGRPTEKGRRRQLPVAPVFCTSSAVEMSCGTPALLVLMCCAGCGALHG